MKIFLDTANVESIVKAYGTGLIDGVTTNPTLILAGGRTIEDVTTELIQSCPNLISVSTEVVADTATEMIEQGRKYIPLGDAVTIKVPCTVEGLKACKTLTDEGFKVNVTLIFSVTQAILAAKAGATYVSPFVGRLNDNSFGGIALIQAIAETYSLHRVRTQVLAASVREVNQVGRCFAAGADVCTIPPKVFWGMYNHILTDKGLELFQADWETANSKNQ
jgi:transaldolase